MTDTTIDTTLALLASRRRRLLIRRLGRARGEWVTAGALADWIVDRSVGAADPATRQSVTIDLHHAELPKLADAAIVDYDPARRLARYRGGPDQELVEELLDLAEGLRP